MSLADKIKKRNNISQDKFNKKNNNLTITPDMNVSTIERTKRSIAIFNRENKLPLFELTSIDFSVFSEEVFEKKKIVDITEVNRNVNPFYTIEDPRLGTIQNFKLCSCCEKTTEECIGHFGRIKVNFNFIHPSFILIVIHVLNCKCHTCDRMIMTKEMIYEKGYHLLRGIDRLSRIAAYSIKNTCPNPNCGLKIIFKTSKISENKSRAIPYYIKKDKTEEERYMSIDKIKKKLTNLTDEEVHLMGFENTHPKDFIMNYIPVIPMTDRPPAFTDNEKTDHSITFAYNDEAIKINESKYLEDPEEQEECNRRIIFIYDHLIDNKKGDYTRNQNDVVGSIKDELVGKTGIIRSRMLGKRANYTARTVIGPNKTLNFGYIAPPNDMKKVTMPEIITRYNYEQILTLASEGKIRYFCPSKGKSAGRKIRFDYVTHKDILNYGDRIERESQNGDIIIFNRQPTLQKQSMLGYIAQFQNKQSIGIHLANCSGLNADFDGDEGNEHFLQTIESQTEARLIMYAPNNIMSVSTSRPEASMVFNSVVSAFMLTEDGVKLTRREFDECLENIYQYSVSDYVRINYNTLADRLGDVDPLSGKALFSVLFPSSFWYQHKDDKGNRVLITNGVLRQGRIKNANIGGGAVSIIQSIYKWHGKQAAADFISAASFLLNWYIYKVGFSLSFEDFTLREHEDDFIATRKEIVDTINSELFALESLTGEVSELEKEERESEIKQKFALCDKKIEKEVSQLFDTKNSLFTMINSGAKGKLDNIIHMTGSRGTIVVGNELPSKTMSEGTRWLSSFHPEDVSLESRGYAINSLYEGLDVDAYFAFAQSGRIGLIDTAVKTANTGYMQRKMVKAQEDLVVNHDGSIRNQVGIIFQFSFGPNFSLSEMLMDNSDQGFSVFSFINIKELFGKISYENGFDNFDIKEEVNNIIRGINKSYNYEEEELINIYNEENETDEYFYDIIDEDGGDDGDDDFDDEY